MASRQGLMNAKRKKERKVKKLRPAPPGTKPMIPQYSRSQLKKMRKKNKEEQRNPLGENQRQVKGDPRMGKNGISKDLVPVNSNPSITLAVPLQQGNMWGFAIGYVTRALEKGYSAAASQPWNPYFAWIYTYQLLTQYAAAGTPPILKLPKVLLYFARTLTPKTLGFANGKVAYSMQVVSSNAQPIVQPIGFFPYGYAWNTGWVQSVPQEINGFPVATVLTTTPYSDDLGAIAFSEMNNFLSQKLGNEDFAMVDSIVPTPWDKEVGPFAIVEEQEGAGVVGSGFGGFGVISQLEVPIHRPLLTLFNAGQVGPAAYSRYPVFTQNASGDPCVLGGFAGNLIPLSHFGMKRPIKFHCVDFNEFLDVGAQWVAGMQQQSVNDQGGNFSETNPPSGLTCPLTLQEFALLLRNVCMDAFKATQAGVQGLYPILPSGNNDNQFQPFVASATTCFLQSVQFSLPLPLVENLRCLTVRWSKRSNTDWEMFCPVLGQYKTDTLSSDQYFYSYNGVQIPAFTVPTAAGFKKKTIAKDGSEIVTVMPEQPISLVDGNSNGTYVAINDIEALKKLSTSWESWLKNSGVSTFSVPLCQLSEEQGVNILCSINMTRHWVTSDVSRSKRLIPDRFMVGTRAKKISSVYSNRLAIADTSQSQFITGAYTQFQSQWILPIIENEFESPNDVSTVTRWQALMSEPYLMNLSTGYDGVELSDLHFGYAQKLIRNRQQGNDDWIQFFQQMTSEGRGGILASLAAGALTALFPSAGPELQQIADFIPI